MSKVIRFVSVASAILSATAGGVAAQDRPARFEREEEPAPSAVRVFHSTQTANLQTAESLSQGEWLFEISHRFLPPISDGSDALWGLDGPVYNRLALSYAVSDRAMLGIMRTNLRDNVELNAKVRIFEHDSGAVPLMGGIMAGFAWNTDAPLGADENESQAYLQLLVNALLWDRLAVGVVPTILRNPRVVDFGVESALVLGIHGQWYMSDQTSLLGEWILSETQEDLDHDGGSFGIELEVGGHFFKILVTNQARMNPTQFLGGTAFPFEADEWRFGFNITRLLTF